MIQKTLFCQEPETFEKAVKYIAENFSDGNKIQNGMDVRNDLGLWNKNSKLYLYMLNRFGLGHADDTSSLIVSAANALINNREYSPDADVEKFKNHWINYGIDPATLEKADWTAYYAPKGHSFNLSGFKNEKSAKNYTTLRTDLDPDAWFVLETKYFEKCEDFNDITTAAGYYPSKQYGSGPDYGSERWLKYEEQCQRIGCPIYNKENNGKA